MRNCDANSLLYYFPLYSNLKFGNIAGSYNTLWIKIKTELLIRCFRIAGSYNTL